MSFLFSVIFGFFALLFFKLDISIPLACVFLAFSLIFCFSAILFNIFPLEDSNNEKK